MKQVLKAILLLFTLLDNYGLSQVGTITGIVSSKSTTIPFAKVMLKGQIYAAISSENGRFTMEEIPFGNYEFIVFASGYEPYSQGVEINSTNTIFVQVELNLISENLEEVVVSGTMKEVSKLDSPVPVEVYSAQFFKSNPTPSIFEAIQNINGVRPQLNCNVCNTGDIHINGLEGPYTMILIDGMPIVSGLATVYGLSGIPQSLIDRVEVVKGPASTLYGSEAVGGLINIITKKTKKAASFSAEFFGTSWAEMNLDLAAKANLGKLISTLLGLNYFNYAIPLDLNADNFTDVTLQNRVSVFNKWNVLRPKNKLFEFVGRYVYEDRWGGDMRWTKEFRGGDSIYGESINTKRWEIFGSYQFPGPENITFQWSANGHFQNSAYGKISFNAKQVIGFGQLLWKKEVKRHDLLMATVFRYTFYDDNTPATATFDTLGPTQNKASTTYLPGVFIQDELTLNENNKLLIGLRYDYNSLHGTIVTPRINYKWNSSNRKNVLRISFGNGYRVANVFTEDHAALTGAREIEFIAKLKPEKSWNGNINFVKKFSFQEKIFFGIDATIFYTYFINKIIADYLSDPNKIRYDNLNGYAISRGASSNFDVSFPFGLQLNLGLTFMDVFKVKDGKKVQQLFSEKFTGTWLVRYELKKWKLSFDYTGNFYSPMRLPLLGPNDPRAEFSPWWSIQNIQVTKIFNKGFELFGGVKNLLNWTPNKGNPFIIARSNDPFDKEVQFDANDQAMVTTTNPYGLTFDPTYVYGPNQGIRVFLGFRYAFK